MKKYELAPKMLRATCEIDKLTFKTTEDIPPFEGIIGQERAARAIEFGLKIKNNGYNIFVAGIPGTGRTTSVETAVRKIAQNQPVPDDWCYIYNFALPHNPKALKFPPGKASIFKKDMNVLVEELKTEIPKAFESKIYEDNRNQLVKTFQKKREELLATLEISAKQASFQIKQTPSGISFTPMAEGKPLTDEEMDKLTLEAKNEIKSKQDILYEDLTEILRAIREEEKKAKTELSNLEKETSLFTIQPQIEELKEKYKEFPEVIKYLDNVEKDMVENIDDFKEKKESEILPGLKMPGGESSLFKYNVTVLIDNSKTTGAPVIKEINPTVYNLIGRIEYRPQWGSMVTDFTMIKPGAIHRANGGYLILNVLDLLKNYFAWDTLKRTIKNKEIAIEDLNEQFRVINTPTIKPEPIPADVKFILIGNPYLYYLLQVYDEDFRKLFKVKADFSLRMDRDKKGIQSYASFVSKLCKEENLKHFDKGAVAKIIEYGSRAIEDQKKLTTRFIDVADLIRESSFWAETDNSKYAEEKHVKKALEEKIYRSNMIEKRIEELIKEGTIMVDTEGEVAGQINGLSVLTLGDYSFGKPSRITATVYAGKDGVMNIEREVKLAGTIHNKGFLILSGFIGEKYGTKHPLIFSASLCFEQLYEEIEGDSASSTELYVLLSSLSGLPLKQEIAVTGSVNQKGEIQPVGGINEKIEGFYYTCKSKELTGSQGVIIPEKNIKHLMLNDEVLEAIKKKKFHVWAVKNVDEGIEILTGLPAGKRKKDGTYSKETVHYLVSKHLDELTRSYLKHQKQTGNKKNNKKKKNGI